MRRPTIALSLASMLIAFPAAAHEGATGVVKERMDSMKSMAQSVKAIKSRIEANRDAAGVAAEARKLAGAAPAIPSLFPAGSDHHPSMAKPEVWRRTDAFRSDATALEQASLALVAAAQSENRAAIKQQFAVVTHACSSCHTDFRQKK